MSKLVKIFRPGLVLLVAAGLACSSLGRLGYTPSDRKVLRSNERRTLPAYDLFGRPVAAANRAEAPSPADGAVTIDDDLLANGEKAYNEETFGNEIVLTEVVGMLDGPLTAAGIAKAVAGLKGEGTTNLRVPLAKTAIIGGYWD
jgi:hypothetical protein